MGNAWDQVLRRWCVKMKLEISLCYKCMNLSIKKKFSCLGNIFCVHKFSTILGGVSYEDTNWNQSECLNGNKNKKIFSFL